MKTSILIQFTLLESYETFQNVSLIVFEIWINFVLDILLSVLFIIFYVLDAR